MHLLISLLLIQFIYHIMQSGIAVSALVAVITAATSAMVTASTIIMVASAIACKRKGKMKRCETPASAQPCQSGKQVSKSTGSNVKRERERESPKALNMVFYMR